ncbi:MAG: hypothetical protein OXF79_26085 [Chloroflexi bacterium]|nr:hypothetical protein [Chloroflexota bacterium]
MDWRQVVNTVENVRWCVGGEPVGAQYCTPTDLSQWDSGQIGSGWTVPTRDMPAVIE